jgi:pimeloyl-ACP methyl ester carboxylesterase
VNIVTPKKYELNGLWFGGKNPRRAVIFVHGLASSAFGNQELLVPLASEDMAVVYFSNRGSYKVSGVKKIDLRKKKGYSRLVAGETFEIFGDCVDDLQGVVNLAKDRGVKEIYIVGHSTGSQKNVYYLSQRNKQQDVRGVILMAPMSDYAGAIKFDENGQLERVTKIAKRLVDEGKPQNLLPLDEWPAMHSAQRFLSLYTPESSEEIFCYGQPGKLPKTLRKIRIPTLVILAGKDEYRDRPMKQLAKWFEKNVKAGDKQIEVINNAPHNFYKFETKVVDIIKDWINRV